MALAVRAAQLRQHRPLVVWLILTMVLGAAFPGNQGRRIHRTIITRRLIPGWNFEVPEHDRAAG